MYYFACTLKFDEQMSWLFQAKGFSKVPKLPRFKLLVYARVVWGINLKDTGSLYINIQTGVICNMSYTGTSYKF